MDLTGLARRTRRDFARRWRLVFAWQLLVQLFGIAAIAPVAAIALAHLGERPGPALPAGHDVVALVLSPTGALLVLATVLAAVAFHVAQFAGYTWVAAHALARRPVSFRDTLGAVRARLPLLAAIGARMTGRGLALALPFLVVGALEWRMLLDGLAPERAIVERPAQWDAALGVVGALGGAYAFVTLRQFAYWIYTMPLAMLDAVATASDALATSERMLEGRLLRAIAPLVAWWGLLGAASLAVAWCARLAGVPAALAALLLFVYSTLQFAGHQFLITRTFAERGDTAVDLPGAAGAAGVAVS